MFLNFRSKNKIILLIIVIIVLLAGIVVLFWLGIFNKEKIIYCAQDAKLCPDGSYVGCEGPNCEFAFCLGENGNELWKTAADEKTGIYFKYPERLLTEYINVFDWPPQVQVLDEPFACVETGEAIARAGRTERRVVDDRIYCVTEIVEGAAGSIYTKYAYAFARSGKILIFTFTLRSTQCGNYDEPRRISCENEREAFYLDGIIDRMAKTVTGI